MSRKRGKQRKPTADAVPEEVLAEGSGPVRGAGQDAITTVEDVVTTDDIATTEDVVTADDIVATGTADDPPDDGAGQSATPEDGDTPAGRAAASTGDTRTRSSRRAGARAPRPAGAKAARPAARWDAADRDEVGSRGASRADSGEVEDAAGAELDPEGPGADADGLAADPGADRDDRAADGQADADGLNAGARSDREGLAADGQGDREGQAADGQADADGLNAGAAAHGNGSGAALDEDGAALDGDAAGEDADGAADGDDAAAVFPTSAQTMDPVQLKHLVEALIFAADRPLTVQRLRQLTRVGDVRRLEQALAELSEDYCERGLVLQQVSGGYQFRTRTQFSAWVQQLIAGRPVRLSRAQLETLAIIAYRQPITRPEIDDIRGVDSSATLKLLIDRMLIRVLGKREEVGRPMLYGTTKEFLDFFSLGDLRELPTLREYSELTAESRKVMSDRLGIAPDGSDGGDPDGSDGGPDGGGSDGGGSDGGGSDGGPVPGAGGGGAGGLSDHGSPASAADAGVGDALSAFWAASDTVDRSDAAVVGDTDDDAPADTWFDPSIGDVMDDAVDAAGQDEPLDGLDEAAIGSARIVPAAE